MHRIFTLRKSPITTESYIAPKLGKHYIAMSGTNYLPTRSASLAPAENPNVVAWYILKRSTALSMALWISPNLIRIPGPHSKPNVQARCPWATHDPKCGVSKCVCNAFQDFQRFQCSRMFHPCQSFSMISNDFPWCFIIFKRFPWFLVEFPRIS